MAGLFFCWLDGLRFFVGRDIGACIAEDRPDRHHVVIPNEVRDLRLPVGGSPRIYAGEERFSAPETSLHI